MTPRARAADSSEPATPIGESWRTQLCLSKHVGSLQACFFLVMILSYVQNTRCFPYKIVSSLQRQIVHINISKPLVKSMTFLFTDVWAPGQVENRHLKK